MLQQEVGVNGLYIFTIMSSFKFKKKKHRTDIQYPICV